MKLDALTSKKRLSPLPLGTHEVTFLKFDWYTDKEQNVKGAWIHIEGYKPLYLNYFDDAENFQLDFLLDQLGVDSYDPEDINEAHGTVIKCTRYPNDEYINTSFNPKPKTDNFA